MVQQQSREWALAALASTSHSHERRNSFATTNAPGAAVDGHLRLASIEGALEQLGWRLTESLDEIFAQARASAPEPPPTMTGHLARLFVPIEPGAERRTGERATLLATVVVVPLCRNMEPCGEPFKAAARDASERGLSLLHTRAVVADYLAVQWPSLASPQRMITVVLRVMRGRPLGPFYEVAGEFVWPR